MANASYAVGLGKLITVQPLTNNSDLVVKAHTYQAWGYIIRLLGRDFRPERVAPSIQLVLGVVAIFAFSYSLSVFSVPTRIYQGLNSE